MSTLTYRNSNGQLVDLPAVAATRLKNGLGSVMEQVMRGGAVAITRHEAPKAVLLAYDEFVALTRDRAPVLNDLAAEYDTLLGRMQTPAARKAVSNAFNATPEEMGRAAMKAARKKR
jgi:prevent-host-death family protein